MLTSVKYQQHSSSSSSPFSSPPSIPQYRKKNEENTAPLTHHMQHQAYNYASSAPTSPASAHIPHDTHHPHGITPLSTSTDPKNPKLRGQNSHYWPPSPTPPLSPSSAPPHSGSSYCSAWRQFSNRPTRCCRGSNTLSSLVCFLCVVLMEELESLCSIRRPAFVGRSPTEVSDGAKQWRLKTSISASSKSSNALSPSVLLFASPPSTSLFQIFILLGGGCNFRMYKLRIGKEVGMRRGRGAGIGTCH